MKVSLAGQVSLTALLFASIPCAANAQTAPAAASASDDPAKVDPAKRDEAANPDEQQSPEDVVVTGSRLRGTGLRDFEPHLGSVGQQYLQDRGFTNVADALNELPGIRGSVTPAAGQGSFGQAVNFINLFGLGSNRTLTLINGQRVVSSNVTSLFAQGAAGVQVDSNIIPSALVTDVDIVLVGGAPVYGADAIAGTVNYKLNTRFTGVQASVLTGVSERGDGFRYNGSVAAGHNFLDGRANITIAYTRDSQEGVVSTARDFLNNAIGNATNPSAATAATLGRAPGIGFANDGRLNTGTPFNESATDGVPPSVLIFNPTNSFLTQGGLITAASRGTTFTTANNVNAAIRNFQFDPSGNLVPFDRGIPFVGTASSGGQGFRGVDYTQITSTLVRDSFNGYASFNASDAFKFFVEGTYYHARGDELIQQPSFNSSLFAGSSSGQLTYDVNNPFLTTQARTQLQTLGVNRFQVSRASNDLADLTGFSNIDLFRIVGGVKGDFKVGKRDFYYSVTGNYGRNDILDSGQDINAQNFVNAVNVTTNAAGQIVCNPTPAFQATPVGTPVADAACRPLNLFGRGVSSQEARDYVIQQTLTRSVLQQYDVLASVGGSPFDLFGNKVDFSLGYEHREERGRFTPDAFQQAGRGRSVAITPLSGSYNTDEVYGELHLPVVTSKNDIPFLNRFELLGRFRYTDNSLNGGFLSWSAGAIVEIVKDVSFHGNYTRSFRAPALTELFLPRATAFSTVTDYCSPANIGAGAAPDIRRRNCAAFLAAFPNSTPLDAAAATVPIVSGGNVGLNNEIARNFTYGVTLRPRWIPGFELSVDYINIKISNPISNLSVAQIGSACFDNPNFNLADPANGNAFCSRIGRYPAGTAVLAANGGSAAGQVVVDQANPAVVTGFVNGNRIFYDQIQAQFSYVTGLEGLKLPGRLSLSGDLTYVRTRLNDVTGVAPVRTDGTIGDPTWQGQLNFRYAVDGVALFTSFNYYGEQLFSRVSRGIEIRELDKYPAYWVINPSLSFTVNDRFQMTLSVSNVTDQKGQTYFGSIIPGSYNGGLPDLGRRFSAAIRTKF